MEFSNAYAISPAFGSVTKTLFYSWASFTDQQGGVIPARVVEGRPLRDCTGASQGPCIMLQLDGADAETQRRRRVSQPNFFLPFDRTGIDPFTQRFPITLRLEGTVRGTGGLRIVDDSCATTRARSLRGRRCCDAGVHLRRLHRRRQPQRRLGDVFRLLGRPEAPPSSARQLGAAVGRQAFRRGTVGLRSGNARPLQGGALARSVQDEVFPYELNYFREAGRLERVAQSAGRFVVGGVACGGAGGSGTAARARSRCHACDRALDVSQRAGASGKAGGMHRRDDYPEQDDRYRHYVTSGGLDDVWTSAASAGLGAIFGGRGMIEVIDAERCTGVRHLRQRVPDQCLRQDRRHSNDRTPERLPDLLPVRALLPGGCAVRLAVCRCAANDRRGCAERSRHVGKLPACRRLGR